MVALRAAEAKTPPPTLASSYGADPRNVGELRLPKGPGPFPVAVLLHGGCWTVGYDTLAGARPLAQALAERGIATWNIEYRQVGDPGAGWPGTFDDVAAGVDHLATLARRAPLDLHRVIFVGHSAGAHLALWAASRPKLGGAYAAAKVRPMAVVAIDGPATLAPFIGVDARACGKPVIVPFMGGTPADKPAAYALASPADHLPLGARQLIVEASFAPLMKPYAAAARAAGDPVEELVTGDDHFDVVTPGTVNGDKVVDLIVNRAFAMK